MPIIEKKPPLEPPSGSFSWSASPPNHRKVLRWSTPIDRLRETPAFTGISSGFVPLTTVSLGLASLLPALGLQLPPPPRRRSLLRQLRALTPAPLPCVSGFSPSPAPFCILDEIEAALDDANIGYFADYLAEYSKGTQFVVVTHRKGTMERCNALYGVAMEEQGVSRMVSVSLQDYE